MWNVVLFGVACVSLAVHAQSDIRSEAAMPSRAHAQPSMSATIHRPMPVPVVRSRLSQFQVNADTFTER